MSPLNRSCAVAAFASLVLLTACGSDDASSTDDTTTTGVEEADGREGTPTEDAGAGEDGDVTVDELLEAVEATRAVETATVELALGFDGGELLGAQEAVLSGSLAVDGSEADIRVAANGEEDAARFVVLDDRAWVGGVGADVRGALPEGADWAELPAEDLLASDGFENPGDLAFLYLVGGATDIQADGDGYRFDVDLDAATASAPEELREQVASNFSFTGSEPPEITGEVTLDDEGRISTLSVVGVQRPSAEEAEQLDVDPETELRLHIDVSVTDVDEQLDIEEPAGEIVPLSEAPDIAALLGLSGT